MGLEYNVYLTGHKIYGCKNCKAHLSNQDDIISRVGGPKSLFPFPYPFCPPFFLLTSCITSLDHHQPSSHLGLKTNPRTQADWWVGSRTSAASMAKRTSSTTS